MQKNLHQFLKDYKKIILSISSKLKKVFMKELHNYKIKYIFWFQNRDYYDAIPKVIKSTGDARLV